MASKIPTGRRGSVGSPPHRSSKISMEAAQEITKEITKNVKDLLKEYNREWQEKIDAKFKEMDGKINEKLRDMKEAWMEEMAFKNQEFKQELLTSFQNVAHKVDGLAEKVEEIEKSKQILEKDVEELKQKPDKNEAQILIMQYRMMEGALRVRGVPEKKQENLRKIFAEAFAQMLQMDEMELAYQIDKIYRVNSWFARQKQLPRDIVIYFVKRTLRNQILEFSYRKKLEIDNQEVMILKEIPPKMLRDRKDFSFLTKELKQRRIDYRWEVPYGLTVFFQGRVVRIFSVLKAREFLSNTLKVEAAEDMMPKQNGKGIGERVPSPQQALEQRVTRAATKRMEQQEKEREKEILQIIEKQASLEAVGGARPKQVMEVQQPALQLHEASNGK